MRILRRAGLALMVLILVAACAGEQEQGLSVSATRPPAQPSATEASRAEEPSATPEPSEPTEIPADTETVVPTEAPAPSATPQAADAGTLYFLRDGSLVAYDIESETERDLNVSVESFRVAPDGRAIALLDAGELALLDRDGEERQAIASGILGDLAWAPDSSALAFVSGFGDRGCTPQSEVYVLELASSPVSRPVGTGCQPAWSPESKRLAFVTYTDILSRPDNELRLVNRQGQNGWAPTRGILADETFPDPRRTFSSPWWAADGKQIFMIARFSEFVETTWSTIEQVDAVEGTAQPVGVALDIDIYTLRPSPDRSRIAYLSSGAKGTNFLVLHTPLAGERSWNPPWYEYEGVDKSMTLRDEIGVELEHVYAMAWAPDGRSLAIVYCMVPENPVGLCEPDSPAELRLLDAQSGELSEPLLDDVDLRSPLDWSS